MIAITTADVIAIARYVGRFPYLVALWAPRYELKENIVPPLVPPPNVVKSARNHYYDITCDISEIYLPVRVQLVAKLEHFVCKKNLRAVHPSNLAPKCLFAVNRPCPLRILIKSVFCRWLADHGLVDTF